MNKKYVWVVVGLMILTAILILIDKGVNKSSESENIKTEEITKDDNLVSPIDSKPADKEQEKPGIINEVPKGKMPAVTTPVANPSVIQANTWVWSKTIMSDDKIITPNKPGVFTLTLKADGNASGKTDCNGFFGDYKVGTDGVISFGPFASTMMYCEGSQEREYTETISKATRYMVDESGNLVLLLPLDSGSILFRKQ